MPTKRLRQSKPKEEAQPAPAENESPIYFWKPEQPYGFLGQCYMMHRKGLLFAPTDPTTEEVLSSGKPVPHPSKLRSLGRQIPNFDERVWNKERFGIVVEGNYLKFTQDEELKEKLLETGDRELVEASPRDRIWGVGFGAKNAGAMRSRWGMNLLGKALMEVRERIKREETGAAVGEPEGKRKKV